jgi:pimeloyl-ACP methyl ester carboxylesterase
MYPFAASPTTPPREVLPGVSLRPQIVHTAKGPIEFDCTEGPGPVVLAVHGGLGGCDQARLMTAWIDPSRYHILSPSRPGYLGTPLETGQTMEQQADALAALLDILGIQRATVVGVSAGGPSAYLFAVRHPKRVAGLVVIDGVSGNYDPPETVGPLEQVIFLSDLGQKVLQKVGVWNPRVVMQGLFHSEGLFTKTQIEKHIEYVMADEELLAFVKAFTDTMSPYRLRKEGTENDIQQFRQYTHLPVERIRCPSLIVHGTHDADVKFYDGVYAYEHIPNAERFWIEEGSHLGFWLGPNAPLAQQAAQQFIDRCNRR